MDNDFDKNKERVAYFDHIKILAISLVILIHIFCFCYNNSAVGSTTYYLTLAVTALFRIAVPLFFMVSGALHLDENKSFDIKKFYVNTVLRFIICFIAWDFVYANLKMLFGFLFQNITVTSYISELTQNMVNFKYHLWFLKELIAILFIVPLLRLFVKKENKNIIKFFLILIAALIAIKSWCTLCDHKTIMSFISCFLPFDFINYLFYFVLGWFLHNCEISQQENKAISVLGICSIVILPIINVLFAYLEAKNNVRVFTVESSFLIFNLFFAVFVFVKFKNCKNLTTNKFILLLESNIFGVYLTHVIFNDLFFELIFSKIILSPIWCLPVGFLAFIMIFISSFILTFLIKKVLGKLSKWII